MNLSTRSSRNDAMMIMLSMFIILVWHVTVVCSVRVVYCSVSTAETDGNVISFEVYIHNRKRKSEMLT